MSHHCGGKSRSNTRTLVHLVGEQIGAMRTAFARRRAMRELESMPYEIRKDIGWRSDI